MGRAFIGKFDVMVDLSRNFIQIRNPEQRYRLHKEEVLTSFRGKVSANLVNNIKLAPIQMRACCFLPLKGRTSSEINTKEICKSVLFRIWKMELRILLF